MSGWDCSAFVATPGNVPLEAVPGSIQRLWIPVAWGTEPRLPDSKWLEKAREWFEIHAWAWCEGADVEGEARVHADCAQAIGAASFSANMEEHYDAHGDASSPKMGMPNRYLGALPWDGPLAVTTTPRFASDLHPWMDRGALYQPQAFPLETGVGLIECVEFARDYLEYPIELIRPLIQAYPTNGKRVDPTALNEDAASLGVGGIPYTIEQACDVEGQAWLEAVRPTITRVQAAAPPGPDPHPDPGPEGKPPFLPFAGALYPPSDPQKRGPTIGDHVIAVKRAVSRAGYWPWQSFDDVYNENFAGAVQEFQAEHGIQATGNYGEKTHDALTSTPAASPHSDQWAFDAKAIDIYRKWGAPKIPFYRPLYGPDDPQGRGGKDGTKGDDVIAVKRALSRAGFMEWGEFTNVYGRHTVDACKAFQRSTGTIQVTGNYGSNTHEALRINPRNADEWSFDSYGIELYTNAGTSKKDVRLLALEEAKRWLGTKENPPNSNQCVFTDWYGMIGPWCAMFVTYCFEKGAAGGSPTFVEGSRYAYVPYILNDARASRHGLSVVSTPTAGDLVIYDWEVNSEPDHVGIFEAEKGGGSFSAIEGNTSTSSDSDGGEVMRRTRSRGAGIYFVRVAEP